MERIGLTVKETSVYNSIGQPTKDNHNSTNPDDLYSDQDLDTEGDIDEDDPHGYKLYANNASDDDLESPQDLFLDDDANENADGADVPKEEQEVEGSNVGNSNKIQDTFDNWKSKNFWKYIDSMLVWVRQASQDNSDGTCDGYKANYVR